MDHLSEGREIISMAHDLKARIRRIYTRVEAFDVHSSSHSDWLVLSVQWRSIGTAAEIQEVVLANQLLNDKIFFHEFYPISTEVDYFMNLLSLVESKCLAAEKFLDRPNFSAYIPLEIHPD